MLRIGRFTSLGIKVVILLPFVRGALDYKNLSHHLEQDDQEISRILEYPDYGESEKLFWCLKHYKSNLQKLTNLVKQEVEGIKEYAWKLHLNDGPKFYMVYVHPGKIKKGFHWTQQDFDKLKKMLFKVHESYLDFHEVCNSLNCWFHGINLKQLADLAYSAYTR